MQTSAKPQHTPGPWEIETCGWSSNDCSGGSIGAVTSSGSFTTGPDGKPILQYATRTIINYTLTGNGISVAENSANARLISAAPDLLEALRQLVAIGGTGPLIDQARAAIAKAALSLTQA